MIFLCIANMWREESVKSSPSVIPGLDDILLEVQDTMAEIVGYTLNSSASIYHANNYR